MHSRLLSLCLSLPALCTAAFVCSAQDTLATARVTASQKPVAAHQSAPLQALDNDDLQRLGVRSVSEAVRSFSGVSIRDYGGIGGIKTVSIRNLGAQHTAVVYDGMTMTDLQSGQIDIGRFQVDNISALTLTIGQSDDIFRSARAASSAGALEIRTLRPVFEDGRGFNAGAGIEISSFRTYNPSLTVEKKIGSNWSVGFTGDYLESEGTYPFTIKNGREVENRLRLNSDVSRLRSEANLYGSLPKGELHIKGNLLSSDRGLPGSVVYYNEKADERLSSRDGFASVSYNSAFSGRWELKADAKFSRSRDRYSDKGRQYPSGKIENNYDQKEWYASAVALYRLSSEIRFSLAQDLAFGTLDSDIPECAFPRRWTSLTALSGQYRSQRLTLTASALGTVISERVLKGEAAPQRSRVSPSLSLSYRLLKDSDLRVRASFRGGFRAPTFNDLYYSRVGNLSLKPEKARQFNLGVTYNSPITLSVDAYFNRVEDKIVAIPTLFIWKMRNVGKVNIAGADLNASGQLTLAEKLKMNMSGGLSFQKAVDVTDPSSATFGHQIPYAPKLSASASLAVSSPWANFSYTLSAVGDRYAYAENIPKNIVEGYADHSVSVHREFPLGPVVLRLQGDVTNLSGRNYCVIQYYPMPGRTYRITMKIKYQ